MNSMKNIKLPHVIIIVLQIFILVSILYQIKDQKDIKSKMEYLSTQIRLTNSSLSSQIEEVRKTVIRWSD